MTTAGMLRVLTQECGSTPRCVARCGGDEYLVNGICGRGDRIDLDEMAVYCFSAEEKATMTARAICARK
jgi:hypothetical protein